MGRPRKPRSAEQKAERIARDRAAVASPFLHYQPKNTKPACRLCGEPVYSRAGEHPQCRYLEEISRGPGGESRKHRVIVEIPE